MRSGPVGELMRATSRFAIVGLIGGMAAGCSGDTMRFSENPFSNPFGSAANAAPDRHAAADTPPADRIAPMPRGSVASAPLAPVGRVASAPSAVASPRATGNTHWTVRGGTTITVAQGDTLSAISDRYGVPASAILSSNNLSASQVTTGRQLTIPVYSAASVAAPRPAAPVQQMAAAPAPIQPAPVPGRVVATSRLADAPAPAPRQVVVAAAPVQKPQVRIAAAKPAPVPAPVAPAPVRVAKAPATDPVETGSIEQKPKVRPGRPVPAKVATGPVPAPVPAAPAKPVAAKVEPSPAAGKVVRSEPLPAKAPAPKPQAVAKVEAAKPAPAPAPKAVAAAKPAPAPEPQKVAAVAPAKPAETKPAREPEATGALTPAPAAASASPEFRWPARGRVISGFGGSRSNEGINIAVPDGTPVKAAEAGTVAYAGSEVKGYGNLVLIKHDNGYVSAYAHNGEIEVKRGQRVQRGQTVAKSGQSGDVTSPQLHFELRKGSTPVDPTPLLASN